MPSISFGLNLAPHLFSLFFDAPGSYLRLQGMSFLPYLDCWLTRTSGPPIKDAGLGRLQTEIQEAQTKTKTRSGYLILGSSTLP